LEVTARSLSGAHVIAVAGDIDVSTVAELQTYIDAAFSDGQTLIVVDLENVGFIDSSVLHALVRALRRARMAGGDLAIACVDPSVCRLLEVFGLSSKINVCATAEDAAAAIQPAGGH
jgi:anti-sigma B factor antagonist